MLGPEHLDWTDAPLDPLWKSDIEEQFLPLTEKEELEVEALGESVPDIDRQRMLRDFDADGMTLDSQLAIAQDIRNELLAADSYVRSEDVAALMSPACPGITVDEVRILRDLGHLLSVPLGDRKIYPLFQFARSVTPHPSVKVINDRFGDLGVTAWAVLAWWFGPSRYLDGDLPANFLRNGGSDGELLSLLKPDIAA